MRETSWPGAAERRRRRRTALVVTIGVAVVVLGATIAVVGVVGERLGSWQLPLLAAQAVLTTTIVVRTASARIHRLDRHLALVTAAAPAGSTVTTVRGDSMGAAQLLGHHAAVAPFPVLVDDAEGFSVWTVRRGTAVEVGRRPWSSVRAIDRRDDGYGVRLHPVDHDDGVLTLMPIGSTGSMADRMETPGRVQRFLDRLLARHRAACPPEAGSDADARGADVDWLGPPDRTPPTRS